MENYETRVALINAWRAIVANVRGWREDERVRNAGEHATREHGMRVGAGRPTEWYEAAINHYAANG